MSYLHSISLAFKLIYYSPFFNAGESKQSGLELAGRIDFGTIYNTAHNFYVLGSYTNLFTAKFTKDVAAEGIEDGNRMPYAPRDIASLSFGYQHPVGLDARIGVDYVGQQYSDGANTRVEDASGKEGTIPSYTLLNASVRYKPVGSNATFFLSGYNLADKEYLASRVDGKVAGRERQVFGGIRYDF
ncbi:MAG: TonB-dependent receptor [Methylophilaceae bacterium]|jgi:Fe(3+) dicitrate transport protein|nr:TonB-dependent receptor [Methylophilaceae bacterium]